MESIIKKKYEKEKTMQEQEIDFRAEPCNLLCFKVVKSNESDIYIRFKNGKREKEYSLEEFVEKMNHCFSGSKLQLKIVAN